MRSLFNCKRIPGVQARHARVNTAVSVDVAVGAGVVSESVSAQRFFYVFWENFMFFLKKQIVFSSKTFIIFQRILY